MKDAFIQLLKVKTIVTFILVGSAVALAFLGKVEAKEISSLALMVVAFYFGVKSTQTEDKK